MLDLEAMLDYTCTHFVTPALLRYVLRTEMNMLVTHAMCEVPRMVGN